MSAHVSTLERPHSPTLGSTQFTAIDPAFCQTDAATHITADKSALVSADISPD